MTEGMTHRAAGPAASVTINAGGQLYCRDHTGMWWTSRGEPVRDAQLSAVLHDCARLTSDLAAAREDAMNAELERIVTERKLAEAEEDAERWGYVKAKLLAGESVSLSAWRSRFGVRDGYVVVSAEGMRELRRSPRADGLPDYPTPDEAIDAARRAAGG